MQINPFCPGKKKVYDLKREFKPELYAREKCSIPGMNCMISINSKLEEKEKTFWFFSVQESWRYGSNGTYTYNGEEFYFFLCSCQCLICALVFLLSSSYLQEGLTGHAWLEQVCRDGHCVDTVSPL